MKFKKTIIAASIMAFSTGALADWTTPTAIKTVVFGALTNTQVKTTANAIFEVTAGQNLVVGNMIVFKLTNGAVFNTTGVGSLNNLLDSNGSSEFNLLISPNANELRFEVITGDTAVNDQLTLATSDMSIAPAGIVNLDAVPLGGKVDLLATAYPTTAVTSAKATLNNISLNTTVGAYLFEAIELATCGIVNESDTVDVGELFKKFIGPTTTSTVISNTIAVTANEGVLANKIIIKIAGDFTGIQKVTANPTSALIPLGWKGSDASGNTTGGTANEFKIDGNFAYLTNDTALPGPNPGGSGNIDATFMLDNITVQAERSDTNAFKFDVMITDPAYAASVLINCDKSTYSIERNGSSFLMNTFGTAVKLKISDVSGKDLTGSGKVTFVGYKADGTEVPSTETSYALSKNGTVSIPSSAVVAGFAPTPITDIKKIVTTVESESIIASSVRKHPVTGNKSTIVYVNKLDDETGGI